MDFFGNSDEVIATLAGITLGFCLAMSIVVAWYSRKIVQQSHKIAELELQVQTLQTIIIRHFPGEGAGGVTLNVRGDVNDSGLVAAGRDGRQER